MAKKNKPKNAPRKNDVSPNPADMPEAPRSADEAAPNGQDYRQASQGAEFPIVCIGGSAGGLSAFKAFFFGLPADTDPGIAFVQVQHLAPDHKSILTDLIRRYTRLKAYEVEDGMVVRPNCSYIIPPGRDMACLGGTLSLLEPTAPRGQRLPIDSRWTALKASGLRKKLVTPASRCARAKNVPHGGGSQPQGDGKEGTG
jgi:chemotaxis response regulator CheB